MSKSVIIFISLLFFVMQSAFAQRPLKENFLPYLNSIIPPPLSCLEAYNKTKCSEENCSADNLFNELTGKCELKLTQINTPDGENNDMVKKMQDPEFQKKMAKMSDAEKMKLGMEMAKQYQSQNNQYVREPESVLAALEEGTQIDKRTGDNMLNANKTAGELSAIQKKYDDKHKKIDDWLNKEIAKLPLIKQKVDIAIQDPAKVKALDLQAADKHIAVENDYLKIAAENWRMDLKKDSENFSKFENLLAETQYGDDAKNKKDRQILASHQSMIIQKALELASRSKDIFEEAAQYILNKKNIEKR